MGLVFARRCAASTIFSGSSRPQIPATYSGVYFFTVAASSSKPSHRVLIYSFASSPSLSITCIKPLRMAILVPGLICRYTSAYFANSISRGSTTTSFFPFRITSFLIIEPITGWFSVVFDPIIRNASETGISRIEFVIAPEPSVAARPATVELCHNRAQWSTLLVPITARMNF